MGVPIYLFTGFLESGKTSLIKETLLDPGFGQEEKTLILACEEGMEEYDDAFLKLTNSVVVYIEDIKDLEYKNLKKLDATIEPDRVMIEFNGVWKLSEYLEGCDFPFGWMIVQTISTVDASTFDIYVANMRSLIYEQLLHSEVIIFNRCNENTKKVYLRNNIKAFNKSAQLIYETVNGEIVELGEEDLPFDINADIIEISDDDYGLFYMDAMEHVEKYHNKKIKIKAKVVERNFAGVETAFLFGRNAMVCCADDTSFIGFIVFSKQTSQLLPDEWLELEAIVQMEYDEGIHQEIPVLYTTSIKSVDALSDEFVYFT